MMDMKSVILNGQTALGIELGSTRIKAVLIDEQNEVIATGSHTWENSYIDNIWTYSLDEIWKGIQLSYQEMANQVKADYGVVLETIGSIGFSAMMHGYMVFDKEDKLLTPFRTWRNNMQGQASDTLFELFNYPIPQRWSIAHLYQAVLNDEAHVGHIDFMTTLAGYVHWQLTGEKVLGIGEASGMFPIELEQQNFNSRMMKQFDELVGAKNYPWSLESILPKVLNAGENAGYLTEAGARLLDTTGQLKAGILLCPPEGDAGTGMVATNTISKCTGNVSAGTSIFAMIVLENELSKAYAEIDQVTTPDGKLVAMVHSNNCTSDYNAWMSLFEESMAAMGFKVNTSDMYTTLLMKALEGDADCGGLLSYGYISGEHITHFEEGRPLFVRSSNSNFNLANFMRVHLFAALGALKTGMNILLEQESVKVKEILGHGGLFKTKEVAQKIMSAAFNAPVAVMETASEGGAWGIALLASYTRQKEKFGTLEAFLNEHVFMNMESQSVSPELSDVQGFNVFMERYAKGLAIERAAVECLE